MSILVAITAFLLTAGSIYLLLGSLGVATGIIAMCSSASETVSYLFLILIIVLPIGFGMRAGRMAYHWSKRSFQQTPTLKPRAGGLIVMVLIAGYLGFKSLEKSENNKIKAALDARAAELLGDQNKKELAAWLAESDQNHLDTMTSAESLSLAKELNSLGAKSLTAVQIDTTNHLTKTFLIELPEAPSSRKQLFHWYVEDLKRQNDYAPDLGQDIGEHFIPIHRGRP